MKNGRRIVALVAASIGFAGLAGPRAMAGAHTWDINEVFSNFDGTIQFIELKCPTNGEILLNGLSVTSLATGNSFTFLANLPCCGVFPACCTTNKHILLATPGFAALPGAPRPDHIIRAGFFSVNADTLTYHIYDTFSFSAGQLPTDCITSLYDGGMGPNFTAPNTPTNFAGVTASINACPPSPADITGARGVPDGCVDAFDLGAMLGAWCSGVNDPNPPSPPCENCTPANLATADISGAVNAPDGCVDAFDLAKLLAGWCSVAGGNPCGTCGP